MGTSLKKVLVCTNCKRKGHSIEKCWTKGSGKEGQGAKQRKRSKFKKKGKEKANAAEESSNDGKSDGSVAFINYNCVAFIKEITGATVIIDMGVSSHMIPHQNLLKNYQSFPKPRTIRGANKGTFDALGTGHLKLTTRLGGKSIDIQLKDTLYTPKICYEIDKHTDIYSFTSSTLRIAHKPHSQTETSKICNNSYLSTQNINNSIHSKHQTSYLFLH